MKIKYLLSQAACGICFVIIGLSSPLFAAETVRCGIAVDPQGNTIPVPVGNIPYFKLPDALCAGKKEFTYDYSGTLENHDQKFSFQGGVAQFIRNGTQGIGIQEFYFGFQDTDAYFYSNSTYGGEDKIVQSILQTVNTIQSSATLEKLSVQSSLLVDPNATWSIKSYDKPIPQAPLYKGFVGQPGHQYQIIGNGTTFLWRYDKKTGKSSVIPYQYALNIILFDERGATMEGMGAGYVGPQLVPKVNVGPTRTYNVESEIAQPRLRVTHWLVTLQAMSATPVGYQSTYIFSGNQGMLWNDFGPLKSVTTKKASINLPELSKKIGERNLSVVKKAVGSALYNGNWIPVQFTSGLYKGAALAFSVFWNKTEAYPKNQTTANLAWSSFGWVNYFSGLIPKRVASSYSLLETLYPENPILPPKNTLAVPPYEITLKKFVPKKFNMGFPWVNQLTITIKANTKLRYALAVYANELASNGSKNVDVDNPNVDLKITVSAIIPITQNTLFSKTLSQFYEGAAVASINNEEVGYAWIEHMVK